MADSTKNKKNNLDDFNSLVVQSTYKKITSLIVELEIFADNEHIDFLIRLFLRVTTM